jgi:hypothetical protein
VGTRVTQIGTTRYTVWVNTTEQHPQYADKPKAIARGEREAATHHHVQVTRSTGGRAPRTVATWIDGVRQ